MAYQIGYFAGLSLGAALFVAAVAAGVEWAVTRFRPRSTWTLAAGCFAGFLVVAPLLMSNPDLGSSEGRFLAGNSGIAAAGLGALLAWWLRLRSFNARELSNQI